MISSSNLTVQLFDSLSPIQNFMQTVQLIIVIKLINSRIQSIVNLRMVISYGKLFNEIKKRTRFFLLQEKFE